jgi:hypothetical protein
VAAVIVAARGEASRCTRQHGAGAAKRRRRGEAAGREVSSTDFQGAPVLECALATI